MRALLAAVTLGLSASLLACAASSSSETEEESAESNLTGTISSARTCAIRDAYLRAELTDLKPLTLDELAPAIKSAVASRWPNDRPEAIVSLPVAGLGEVVVVEQSYQWDLNYITNLDFFDNEGNIVVYGVAVDEKLAGFSSSWSSASIGSGLGPALQCASPAPTDG